MILEKHLLFIFFSYLCHYQVTLHERHQRLSCFLFLLDRNTIIFEGQKTGNEDSRSGAKEKMPPDSSSPGSDVKSEQSSSSCPRFFFGRSDFSLSSKTNISKFQFDLKYCSRGATSWMPISWIKDLVYIICVCCSYWDLLTQGEETFEFRHLRDAALRVNSTFIRKHMLSLLDHQRIYHGCPVLKKSSFNLFLKYSVVYINRGCEWGKPTSDKGRKILLTTDRTRKKLPTTDRKNINRLPTWTDSIDVCFIN